MMTVRELINWLEDFDDGAEVVIAMYQRYGCDFAYDIAEVGDASYNNWDGDNDDDGNCVQIVLGSQIGTMVRNNY